MFVKYKKYKDDDKFFYVAKPYEKAEGESQAIKLVNEAANQFFVGNAQLLKRLQVVESSLRNNAKIVVPSDSELVNVIGELAGVLPVSRDKEKKKD